MEHFFMRRQVAKRSVPEAVPSPDSVISRGERKAEIIQTLDLALREFETTSIQTLQPPELRHLQVSLQHGTTLGIWVTPPRWFTSGSSSLWSIDLRGRIASFLPNTLQMLVNCDSADQPFISKLMDDAVVCLTRYLIVCRTSAAGMGRAMGRPLDPSLIAALATVPLARLAAISVELASTDPKHMAAREHVFARLSDDSLARVEMSPNMRKMCVTEVARMRILADRGLWLDVPASTHDPSKITRLRGRSKPSAPKRKIAPHLPLPDDFVSELGQKSAWLINQLGPSVINALELFRPLWKELSLSGITGKAASARCSALLAEHIWLDAEGRRIESLPFPLQLSQTGKKGKTSNKAISIPSWPPTSAIQVFGLANIIECAHLFVVGLSTGPRISELMSVRRDSVRYAKDGEQYAYGKTFKLVQRHDGEERDWALPDFAVHALEQQVRLVCAYEQLSDITRPVDPDSRKRGNFMWGRALLRGSDSSVEPMRPRQVNTMLRSYATSLHMSTAPGGQPIRTHRFRKTLARLAALAITHAPKILQDVFGHRSIEMTLYYILSDKDLMAEVETVAAELRVMRAQKVVEEMIAQDLANEALTRAGVAVSSALQFGGYGGPAAEGIHAAIEMQRADASRRENGWGASDVRDVAEMLTMQGKTWQIVRPGVLCTKAVGQPAPCSKRRGRPETSNCRSKCGFRLEEAWHREDVDEAIAEALRLYRDETSKGQDLMAALWAAQIREHIDRFGDLRDKWMRDPVVEILVSGQLAA